VSHRSKLRRAANKANLPDKPYIVLDGLRLLLPDKDAHLVQVTWRQLQVQCNGMSNETLTRSLDHLERHGWITRTRIGGQGNPVRYELLIGKPCECRGRPTTSAERMRRMRDKRRKAASDVTLNGSKDLTASGSKHLADVTISGVTSRSSEAVFTCRETDLTQKLYRRTRRKCGERPSVGECRKPPPSSRRECLGWLLGVKARCANLDSSSPAKGGQLRGGRGGNGCPTTTRHHACSHGPARPDPTSTSDVRRFRCRP